MLTPALLLAATPVVDGSHLKPGAICYAIQRGDQAIGVTWQKVSAITAEGKPAWDVIVHQKIGTQFDLRDHFVLRASDLTPISFDSRKSGVEHVRVVYGDGTITTTRPDKPATQTKFSGKIWDGNLWGLTFAALPLKLGARLELPFYQYDKGLGKFTVAVIGTEKWSLQQAWVVEATTDGQRKSNYYIAQAGRTELGYAGPGFSQRVGGDCSALAAL